MNATKAALIERDLAEQFQVVDLEWWMTALMAVGAVTILCLVFAGFWHLVTKADPEPPDIPDFIICTCPKVTNTAGYTLVMEQHVNPKCPYFVRTPKESA